jgi:hypothetical protein
MKKIIRLLSAVSLFAFVTSCEQDLYDKGDSEYSLMRADFVEAFVGNDKQVGYVVTDDDVRLQLTTPYTAQWIQRSDTTYRAVLYYNKVGEKAEAIALSRVSTTQIRKPGEFKSGDKTDPLGMASVWLSGNKKYLNLCLILKTGAVEDDKVTQTLGIIGDTIVADEGGRRTYQLRVFHNQGDVPEYYSQRVYFSVPLDALEVDSLQLSINTYKGVVSKGFQLSR